TMGIRIGSPGSSLKPTSALTLSMWANESTRLNQDFAGLVSLWDGTGYMSVLTNANQNGGWRGYLDGNAVDSTSAPFATAGHWNFCVFTWDGSTAKLYTNGAADGSASIGSVSYDGGGVFNIGSYNDHRPFPSGDAIFQGTMDEGRVMAVAVSADWITADY